MLELQKMEIDQDSKSSWFIGDHVVQDGSLFLATKFDPLFLLIGPLMKSKRTVN